MKLEYREKSTTEKTLTPLRLILSLPLLCLTLDGPATAGDAAHGLELASAWCNACHSIGNEAPRMADAGPLFTDLAKKDADYLNTAINRPHDFMPEFPMLTDADKGDLVAYILSLASG